MKQEPSTDQLSLSVDGRTDSQVAISCQIVPVERRRSGGTRYWCHTHNSDATAKHGRRASVCRAAHVPIVMAHDAFPLCINDYPGGLALWGAVSPVYDTTLNPIDRGIHIHARADSSGTKEIDRTVPSVRVLGEFLPSDGTIISELDAIYYMVSSVFGYDMKAIACTHCAYHHSDRDWFSVHPHQRHLCAGCRRYFRDDKFGIGNPIQFLRSALVDTMKNTVIPAGRSIDIRQSEYPGGLQIWGSNPAFLWTGSRHEEEGIHR